MLIDLQAPRAAVIFAVATLEKHTLAGETRLAANGYSQR